MSGTTAGEGLPLEIAAEVFNAMVEHCRQDAPLECCGILGGVPPRADLFYPLANDDQSETSYNADPNDLIRAHVDLRRREAQILAIYHSHPRWQAVPSRADLSRNYYGPVPRIIISLLAEPPEVRVWRLEPESYRELPWKVV